MYILANYANSIYNLKAQNYKQGATKMKNNKGMGMIQVAVFIIFIILVVAMSVYFTRLKYNEAKIQTVKTDMLLVQWKLKDYVDKQIIQGKEKTYLGTKVSENKEDAIITDFLTKNILTEEEYDKFFVLRDEDLATATLEITNYENSYFLINYDTYEIIVTKGCEYSSDNILYKLSEIKNQTETENQNIEENPAEE